ncbi:MAG: hypothetical protein JNM66_21475 [Bryobacterales bacterium]|nr:hypothetical protein [Bryobacterales bacterium]
MAWANGKLTTATLRSQAGGTFPLRLQRAAQTRSITLAPGQPRIITP